ncbi:MAG: recombinase family protein [Alphaproteobacteria bacterium]|nr:recombinase family protein [Alphaproteobacteria bacterium]
MREDGCNYQEIADWLNDNGYTTTRGRRFRNAHTHSIIKKRKIRDERLERPQTAIIENFDLLFL